MRLSFLLPALFSALTSQAFAQDIILFQLGIQGDFENTEPLAYSGARAENGNFILTVVESFIPMAREQAARATPGGISAIVCGIEYPPFQPTPSMAEGEVVIPLGNAASAEDAALMMLGEIDCQTFLERRSAAAPDITSLLPPASNVFQGLSFTTNGGTRDVDPSELVQARGDTDATTWQPVITLTFELAMTDWLSTETAQNIGNPMDVSVCGEVITSPIIRQAITEGEILISGNFTKEETDILSARIRGDIPCDG